jgi:hypothetical protein
VVQPTACESLDSGSWLLLKRCNGRSAGEWVAEQSDFAMSLELIRHSFVCQDPLLIKPFSLKVLEASSIISVVIG